MNENFICSICGNNYTDLTSYMNCVNNCYKKVKKEEEEAEAKKRAEEINAALNGVKQAKSYYEQKLNEFKEKYPEEYKMNFGNDGLNDIYGNRHDEDFDPCVDYDSYDDNEDVKSIEFSYTNNGKDEPKLSAKVNGAKVEDDHINKLFVNPEVLYLARLLGIPGV